MPSSAFILIAIASLSSCVVIALNALQAEQLARAFELGAEASFSRAFSNIGENRVPQY